MSSFIALVVAALRASSSTIRIKTKWLKFARRFFVLPQSIIQYNKD